MYDVSMYRVVCSGISSGEMFHGIIQKKLETAVVGFALRFHSLVGKIHPFQNR